MADIIKVLKIQGAEKMDKLKKDTNELNNKPINLKFNTSGAESAINKLSSSIAGGIGGAVGGFAGGAILKDFGSAAADYNKQLSLTKDLVGDAYNSKEIETQAKSLRMSKAAYLDLYNQQLLYLQGNGVVGEQAQEQASKTVSAMKALSLGSKKPLDEVKAAFEAFLKTGRTAGLEKFGLDLGKLDAAKKGMSETEFAAKGLGLIIDQVPEKWSKLSESQKSAAANQERINAQMENSKIAIGETFNKVMADATGWLLQMNEKYPGLIENVIKFIGVMAGILAIGSVIGVINSVIGAFGALRLAIIASAQGGIISTFIGALGTIASTLFTTVIPAVWSFTTALLANPITWIVVGVVALVAALIWLANNWDFVKEKVLEFTLQSMMWINSMIENVKTWFNGLGESIKQVFINAVVFINSKFLELLAFFQGLPAKIQSAFETVGNNIKNFFSGVGDSIRNAIESAINFVTDKINGVKNFFQNPLGAFNSNMLINPAVMTGTTGNTTIINNNYNTKMDTTFGRHTESSFKNFTQRRLGAKNI